MVIEYDPKPVNKYEIGDIIREEVGYQDVIYNLITKVLDPYSYYTAKYEFLDLHRGTTTTFWCEFVDQGEGYRKVN